MKKQFETKDAFDKWMVNFNESTSGKAGGLFI